MEALKKNGFMVGVILMVVILLAFAYLVVLRDVNKYSELASSLASKGTKLKSYASLEPKALPTPKLLEVRNAEKASFARALAEGESYYVKALGKLRELRFQPDGEVLPPTATTAISAGYATAISELNKEYQAVKKDYAAQLFPEKIVAAATPFPDVAVEPSKEEPDPAEAGERCRIVRAIFVAAKDAKWGGLTHIGFERRKAEAAKGPPKKEEPKKPAAAKEKDKKGTGKKRPPPKTAKEEELKEVKPVDPRLLYEKVKVSVAGEIRYRDLGPFLAQLYARANDPKDPVLFVIDEINLNKQVDRIPKPFWSMGYKSPDDAKKAALDAEVKEPSATMRLTLSALRWKGFAAAGS